ncbi:MAG: peptidylprolyl isomerase [Gammaproteobacteria bacterium]|nr:peptidylprolyl isomerase [Gammaproteobacteria bacterium]
MHRKIFNCLYGALLLLSLIAPLLSPPVHADAASARTTMENQSNPLVLVTTSQGNIYVELFPAEAPSNVANFLALTEGEVEIVDFDNGQIFTPRYYDGMRFHRVIPELLIQTGSGYKNVFGSPGETLNDEINAISLGLDRLPVVLPDGSFNPILHVSDRENLEENLLIPLYRAMEISSNQQVQQRQFEINQRLRSMTIKQAYENLGYRYTERYPTRAITRGTVVLSNSGPDTNGSEFFISMGMPDWLNGRHTVIGQVVEGMEVAELINSTPVETIDQTTSSTLIYSIRRI